MKLLRPNELKFSPDTFVFRQSRVRDCSGRWAVRSFPRRRTRLAVRGRALVHLGSVLCGGPLRRSVPPEVRHRALPQVELGPGNTWKCRVDQPPLTVQLPPSRRSNGGSTGDLRYRERLDLLGERLDSEL